VTSHSKAEDSRLPAATQRADRRHFPYPRRRLMRWVLRGLALAAFKVVSRLEIRGAENVPAEGPVILAGNHFHFADPVALLSLTKRQVEFVGGFRFPNAPFIVKFIPSLWGYFPVRRGAYSRASLDYSVAVLRKKGVVGIFPEGGSWAQVLRPPRGGIGYIVMESGARVVPVGLTGFEKLFKEWRPKLVISIGKPIAPGSHQNPHLLSHAERKETYDSIGEQVMRAIAGELPETYHGVYSQDVESREAAQEVAAYPFDRADMRGM